jgi:hypothetical protein
MDMTPIQRIKTLLGESDNNALDAILEICLDAAEQEFLSYTGRNEVPVAAKPLIEQLAILRYNQIGNEGLSSQSYSGNSESYLSDYSDTLKANLNKWRKLKLL